MLVLCIALAAVAAAFDEPMKFLPRHDCDVCEVRVSNNSVFLLMHEQAAMMQVEAAFNPIKYNPSKPVKISKILDV